MLSADPEAQVAKRNILGRIAGYLATRLNSSVSESFIPSSACFEGELPTIVVPDDLAEKTLRSTEIGF